MKLRRILAASTAAAIVASAMAVTSFADEKAFSGSATVKTAGGYAWDTVDITMADLIGDIDPADVTKIVVTTDAFVNVQYNTTKTDDPDALYTKVELDAGKSVELSDVHLDDLYYFQLAACAADAMSANVSWDIYAEAAASDDTTTEDTTTDDTTDGDEIVGDDDTTTDGDEIVGDDDTVTEGDDATEGDDLIEGDDTATEGDTPAVEGIDCVYVADAPSYTCTVVADIDTLPVDVVYAPADGDAFNFNDWCGNGVIVTMADGTKTYYQWGGAQVTWGWDIDDDKNEESVGGVNGETWLGSVNSEDLTAQLSIPVEKGAVVEFYTLGWDAYEGTQYTLVIDEALITEGAAEDGDSAGNTEGADDENKNSADTGVEGIAVAAGALALAGAAVIASRKRK